MSISKRDKIDDFFKRIEESSKKQDFPSALNLTLQILKIDPENKKALTEKELLEEIMKYINIDVFSSTNLFMDPWED
jgi:hypothetical protein